MNTRRSTRTLLLFTSLVALALLAACSPAAATPVPSGLLDAGPVSDAPQRSSAGNGGEAAPSPLQQHLIIRNASLTITAADVRASAKNIQVMAAEMGGFVVTSDVSQQYYTGAQLWRASVTVRVPVERLDEARDRVRAEGLTVEQESVTGQDVTDDYTDLQSRLRNQQATEAQLLTIMAGATRTEDVLAVQQQLTAVQEQIELLKGQINYLEQSAALSEIAVAIEPNAADRPLNIPGWNPKGEVRDAYEAMLRGLQSIGTGIIWIVIYFIPVCVIPAAIVGGPPLWWYLRRRKRRESMRRAALANKARKPTPEAPSASPPEAELK